MIGIVVASHGTLATSLINAAKLVMAEANQVISVGVEYDDDTERFQERLEDAVRKLPPNKGVLILTDMFGGTPSNVGMTLHSTGKVEILTGLNLPMLIKALALSRQDVDLHHVAKLVKNTGQSAITIASEVLAVEHPSEVQEQ